MFKLTHKITPCLWFDNQAGLMQAMVQMGKLDIATLQRAFDGQ